MGQSFGKRGRKEMNNYRLQERVNRLEHLAKEQEKINKKLLAQIEGLNKSNSELNSRTIGQMMVG